MADLYNSVCISSVAPTVLSLFNMDIPGGLDPVNPVLAALGEKKLGGAPLDRAVIYNPDAVGLWLYQKYTDRFAEASVISDLALPMLSVMPSVTPVCFASMYSGVMPEVHGIKKYVKPVLTVKTLFDFLAAAGKKVAIVSTEGDSISKIFLERPIDYFIYDSVEEVNEKALELIRKNEYDLITIYNGNYDGAMHRNGPEGEESMQNLKQNLDFYAVLDSEIKKNYKGKNTLLGFCPDHGCHEIDGGCGSHGLDMEDDMNVIHFYKIYKGESK